MVRLTKQVCIPGTKKHVLRLIGVGNCGLAFVLGFQDYRNANAIDKLPGTADFDLGGYENRNADFAIDFDVFKSRVGFGLINVIFVHAIIRVRFCGVTNI